MKVRERDPATLDSALHIALQLEAIKQVAITRDMNDESGRSKGRARAITTDDNKSHNDVVLSKLNEIVTKLAIDRKAFSERLNNVESAIRRYQSSHSQQLATSNGQRSASGESCTSVQSQLNQPADMMSQQHTTSAPPANPQTVQPLACYICGDPTHLMRQCPMTINAGRTGQQWQSTSSNNGAYSGHGYTRNNGLNAATTRGLRGQLDNGHVYLVVHVDGKRHLALLDSGAQLSLAPNKVVDKQCLRPSQQRVFAVNGSPIKYWEKRTLNLTLVDVYQVLLYWLPQMFLYLCLASIG